MTEHKLPTQENILVAINTLIEARIGVHEVMRTETISVLDLNSAKDRVKMAEYKLLMALDDLQLKPTFTGSKTS